MQIVILLAIFLVLTLPAEPLTPLEPGWVLLAVAVYLLGAIGLSAVNTRIALRQLGPSSELTPRAVRRHNALAILTHLWLLGGLAAAVVLGYGWWAWEDVHLKTLPLVGRIVLLAPFVAALILTWLLDYPFYRAVRRRIAQQQAAAGAAAPSGWTLPEYLAYNVRHYLLFICVPVGLIVLAMDCLRLYVEPILPPQVGGHVVDGATLAAAAIVFVLAPLLIARIWKTAPLPPGPLRERLEALCQRLKLRYRDILVWRTGGMIANAGVMGLAGPVRYILLSDALIEHLEPRQVESVFAHEAGHIISHHIPYAVLFILALVGICGAGVYLLAAVLGAPGWAAQLLALGVLAGIAGTGFGWLSRRFERQSDVIAAWAMGESQGGDDDQITPEGSAIFAQALQRVARLNGILPEQANWRHGSIARRVSYILWLGGRRGTRQDIDRLVRRTKWVLWATIVAAAAAIMAFKLVLSA